MVVKTYKYVIIGGGGERAWGSFWISQEQEIFILSCKKKERQKKGYVYICV